VKVPSVGQIAQDFHKFAFASARGLELKCEPVNRRRADGTIMIDSNPDPKLTSSVAEYSHADDSAVIGGFTYRSALAPLLSGKYVFGAPPGARGLWAASYWHDQGVPG